MDYEVKFKKTPRVTYRVYVEQAGYKMSESHAFDTIDECNEWILDNIKRVRAISESEFVAPRNVSILKMVDHTSREATDAHVVFAKEAIKKGTRKTKKEKGK